MLFISLFVTLNSLAQDAQINIIDSETGKAIPYANICFESLKKDQKIYAISSLDGQAKNTISERSEVAISFVGYETQIDTLEVGESKKYFLKPDVFSLNQLVVTATRTEKYLKDVPAITQLIRAKEISNRGINDMATLLSDDVPGIEFHQAGFGADIKMQGLDANYVLFLIDGERMAGETEGNVDYSRINMNDVERIEIVKGASSALYGSQAMGGVINIITKKPRDKVEVSLGGRYQQFNQQNFPDLQKDDDFYIFKKNLDKPNLNAHASLGFQIKKLTAKTSLVMKSADAYALESRDTTVMNIIEFDTTLKKLSRTFVSGLEDYTISQLLEYQLNKRFSVTAKASFYRHNQYDSIKDNKYDQYEDINYLIKAKYQFSDTKSLDASYADDDYKKFYKSEKQDSRKQLYEQEFRNPKLIYTQKLGEKHEFIAGTEYLMEELSTLMFGGLDQSLQEKKAATAIAYLQDEFQWNSKLSMVGGIRFDRHSAYGLHFSPKVSVMYKLIPLTFRVNYAKGFRSPTLKELYMNWDHLGLFVIKGNENLKPETNNYVSFSAEYTKLKLNTSISVYENWFKNKIDGFWSTDSQGNLTYNYANFEDSKIVGLEILLKYKLSPSFFISGGYSYTNDFKNIDNINVSAVAPHSGNIRFEYHLHKRVYDLDVNLSGKITGAKDYYEATDLEFSGDQTVGTFYAHYDAFSMWKLSVSQNFHNGISLVLGVDNIFNYEAPIINFNTSLSPGRRGFVSLNLSVDKLFREFTSLLPINHSKE